MLNIQLVKSSLVSIKEHVEFKCIAYHRICFASKIRQKIVAGSKLLFNCKWFEFNIPKPKAEDVFILILSVMLLAISYLFERLVHSKMRKIFQEKIEEMEQKEYLLKSENIELKVRNEHLEKEIVSLHDKELKMESKLIEKDECIIEHVKTESDLTARLKIMEYQLLDKDVKIEELEKKVH